MYCHRIEHRNSSTLILESANKCGIKLQILFFISCFIVCKCIFVRLKWSNIVWPWINMIQYEHINFYNSINYKRKASNALIVFYGIVLFGGDATIFSEYKLCDLSQFSSINIGNLQGDNIRWNISNITTFLNIWIKMRYFSCCGYKCKHRGNCRRRNFTRSFPTTRCVHLPSASPGS